MNRILPLIFLVQKALLTLSYHYYRLRRASGGSPIDWVVGPDELASMVARISEALPRSYSVSFTNEAAYSFAYDYMYRPGQSVRSARRRKLLHGPLALGRLMNETKGFLYVGATGFLLEALDHREFEFSFLKRRGLKLGVYWCGSEIRSTGVMHEMERTTGLPNVSTYIENVSSYYGTEQHERVQQARAAAAERHADIMFDFPADQAGYLTRHREPFLYFLPDDRFADNSAKFDDLSRIVVTHATTSPIIKGTPLVRSAIAKLRTEGYDFEYVELVGVSNDALLHELSRSHIALNQFYGFTVTVFGVEALAAQCVLLNSSDETVETNLPPGANDAVVVTKHWQVYDSLKALLDEPGRLRQRATDGQSWARRYTSAGNSGRLLASILDTVLDGSYDAGARQALTAADIYRAIGHQA